MKRNEYCNCKKVDRKQNIERQMIKFNSVYLNKKKASHFIAMPIFVMKVFS